MAKQNTFYKAEKNRNFLSTRLTFYIIFFSLILIYVLFGFILYWEKKQNTFVNSKQIWIE